MIMPQSCGNSKLDNVLESLYRYHGGSVGWSVFSLLYIWVLFNKKLHPWILSVSKLGWYGVDISFLDSVTSSNI
jgi:hypothetical protein